MRHRSPIRPSWRIPLVPTLVIPALVVPVAVLVAIVGAGHPRGPDDPARGPVPAGARPVAPATAATSAGPCRQVLAAWIALATADPGDGGAADERVVEVRRRLPDQLRPALDRWWTEVGTGTVTDPGTDRATRAGVAPAPEIDDWFRRGCP